MRRFRLENEYGQTFYLTEEAMINGVEGLGITRANDYLTYGNRYRVGQINHDVSDISLGLVFIKGYEGYRSFISFVSAASSLTLIYDLDESFKCKVAFSSITKGELAFGSLQCSLVLHKLSPWFKLIDISISVELNDDFKIYPHFLPFIYGRNASGRVVFTNTSGSNAFLKIKIIGQVNNPQIQVIKDEEVYQTLRLFIVGTNTIEVSSIPDEEYILVNGNEAYEIQDFSSQNFLVIPPGDCRIEFAPGVASATECHLQIELNYEGV